VNFTEKNENAGQSLENLMWCIKKVGKIFFLFPNNTAHQLVGADLIIDFSYNSNTYADLIIDFCRPYYWVGADLIIDFSYNSNTYPFSI